SETASRGCGAVARLVLVGVGGETIGQVGADPLGADQSCINILLAAEGISGVFRPIICDQLSSARASASGRIKSHSRLPRSLSCSSPATQTPSSRTCAFQWLPAPPSR